MRNALASAGMTLLRRLEPERAHGMAVRALRLGLAGTAPLADDPILRVEFLGRSLRNPIGLAAGFDKDAVAFPALLRAGFGAVEVGTVTPRPQIGNPRPRLFRLTEDGAVINRMGMNGRGLALCVARLAAGARCVPPDAVLGVNVGINKDGADPERDYPALVAAVAGWAGYVVINVSSPNTPGLRDLQGETRLRAILAAINERLPTRPPLFVKVAPDLAERGLLAVVESCVAAGVTGLVVSNTTIARPAGLRSPHAREIGGLSGRPLFTRSTAVLARAASMAAGRLAMIGCGGVANGREALQKIKAGARLVQLYTAFAFEGPALLPRLTSELAHALRAEGFTSVAQAVGADIARVAETACSI